MSRHTLKAFVVSVSTSALFAITSVAQAAPIAQETFEGYTLGTLVGQNGGTGWTGPWQAGAGNTATVVETSASPITFAPDGGTPIEGGDRAVQLTGIVNQITATRTLATPQTQAFYVSYAIRVSAGSWTDTDTFAVHLSDNLTSTANLNFGTRGVDGGGGIFMVRTGTGGPTGDALINGSVAVGDVNFLVARISKLDADGNPTTTFDRAEVWLNPGVNENVNSPNGHFRVQLASGAGLGTINHLLVRVAAMEATDAIQMDSLQVTTDWPVVVSPLPRVHNLAPTNRASYVDPATGIRFEVHSGEAMVNSNIGLLINGTNANVTFGGTANAVTVASGALLSNTVYTAEIRATNSFGTVFRSIQFDTFNQDSFTIEAEDFNFSGGQFYDNPVLCNDPGGSAGSNCYFDRVGTSGIDENETGGAADNAPAASFADIYRWGPDFVDRGENVDTFTSSDVLRRKFTDAPPGAQGTIKDFDVTQIAAGDWLNYTRTFPDGTYAIYLRARSTSPQQVTLSRVSNATTAAQTASIIGSFNIPNTGGAYQFVPLTTGSGARLPVRLSGVETLRLTANEANNNMQWNFLLFAPSTETVASAFIGSITPSAGALDVAPDTALTTELVNATTTVQTNTIKLSVDGVVVTPSSSITKTDAGATVRYAPGVFLPGVHTAALEFRDNAGNLITNQWQFTVQSLPVLEEAWAAPTGSGAIRGFNLRSAQTTDATAAAALPRNLARVEDQLAERVQVDFEGTNNVTVVNLKERADIGDQGFFTSANGFPDAVAQELELLSLENHDNYSVEVTFFLELTPGVVRLGANVNDTFRLYAGRGGAGVDSMPLIVGQYTGEGAATAAQPQYPANFIVTKAGVYAFRLIWGEYVGSSSLELHVKDSEGVSHLLNDDTLISGRPSPIQAFRTRTQEPPLEGAELSIVREANGSVTISWTGGGGTLVTAPTITGSEWTPVPNQSNPYNTTPAGTAFFRVVR